MFRDKIIAAERYLHAQRLRNQNEGTPIGDFNEVAAANAQRQAERSGVSKQVIRVLNVVANHTVKNRR